ncbi:hypothetical protein D3C79_1021390 [compost metagenome]
MAAQKIQQKFGLSCFRAEVHIRDKQSAELLWLDLFFAHLVVLLLATLGNPEFERRKPDSCHKHMTTKKEARNRRFRAFWEGRKKLRAIHINQ